MKKLRIRPRIGNLSIRTKLQLGMSLTEVLTLLLASSALIINDIVRPVILKGSLLGTIHLADDMQQLHTRLHAYYIVVSIIVVITFLIVLLISARMQKLFTGPLFGLKLESIDFKMSKEVENQPPRPDASCLRGIRVLVIDDNATNREILERQTASWGMKSASASRGTEGIEKLLCGQQNGQPFDLVLLDMDLPGMDGLEVARHISGNPPIADVKMIMLTSVGSCGDFLKAKESDIQAYLTKPVRQSELQAALLKVIARDLEKHPEAPKGEAPESIDTSALEALKELQIEGEPDVVDDIVTTYLSGSDALISQLKKALSENDTEVIHRSAHSLTSSSANVGAVKLSEISRELENSCRNWPPEKTASQISVIEAEYEKASNDLKKWIAAP